MIWLTLDRHKFYSSKVCFENTKKLLKDIAGTKGTVHNRIYS